MLVWLSVLKLSDHYIDYIIMVITVTCDIIKNFTALKSTTITLHY